MTPRNSAYTIYAQGATTDVAALAAKARRNIGGVQVGIANTGQDSNDLAYLVEGAAGLRVSPEVPNWASSMVLGSAVVSDGDLDVVAVTAANALASSLRFVRVHTHSVATGAPTEYTIYVEDQQA